MNFRPDCMYMLMLPSWVLILSAARFNCTPSLNISSDSSTARLSRVLASVASLLRLSEFSWKIQRCRWGWGCHITISWPLDFVSDFISDVRTSLWTCGLRGLFCDSELRLRCAEFGSVRLSGVEPSVEPWEFSVLMNRSGLGSTLALLWVGLGDLGFL